MEIAETKLAETVAKVVAQEVSKANAEMVPSVKSFMEDMIRGTRCGLVVEVSREEIRDRLRTRAVGLCERRAKIEAERFEPTTRENMPPYERGHSDEETEKILRRTNQKGAEIFELEKRDMLKRISFEIERLEFAASHLPADMPSFRLSDHDLDELFFGDRRGDRYELCRHRHSGLVA